jgi:Flp pilus assembly protein TadD
MRFADLCTDRVVDRPAGRALRGAALFAMVIGVVGITGCSVLPESLMGRRDAQDNTATSAASARRATVKVGPPIDPLVQQSFDAAVRAQREGRDADAERGYRALIAAHPELGGPHANLGLLFLRADKLADAVAELESATRLGPQQPLYFNQLGIAYRQQGQFAKARSAYETAIALDPAYAAPILNLGILNDLYLADGARALELYGRYLSLVPAGDPTVTRWIVDLKNRKPAQLAAATRKEKP